MSNRHRIVLLITILLILAWPIRGIAAYTNGTCYGWIIDPRSDDNHKYDAECRDKAQGAAAQAGTQVLLITVGGIAAWVLIPGKKARPRIGGLEWKVAEIAADNGFSGLRGGFNSSWLRCRLSPYL